MKSDLAERLLARLMNWDVPRFTEETARVQVLASLKYDEYGGYRPGVKFVENLSRWLEQFSDPAERNIAYDFAINKLVFISEVEMHHLIEVAYPDLLDQRLLRRAAGALGLPAYAVSTVASDPQFQSLQRRTLFLGLSDGARLDQLRRASQLSHEQFLQDYFVAREVVEGAQRELGNALDSQGLPGEASFSQVFLVDDFSGSGRTLLREDPATSGIYKGKLYKFWTLLKELQQEGIFSQDVQVGILLYVATEQAIQHLNSVFSPAGLPNLSVDVVQTIGSQFRVDNTSPDMTQLCYEYYDPTTADIHKDHTPIGYSDCALPLVLGHNTPNNSVCLLWSEDSNDTSGRRALFPRYERHHRDRP